MSDLTEELYRVQISLLISSRNQQHEEKTKHRCQLDVERAMTGTLAQMWGGFLFRFYIAGRFLLSHACWLTDQPKFKANWWYSIDIWSWHDETLIHSLRKTVLNSAVISKVSFSSIFSFHQLLMETSGVFLPLVHKQCVFKQPSFIESCWCFYYVYILKSILMHLIKKSFKQWVLLIRCKWWVIQWLRGHTCTLSLPPLQPSDSKDSDDRGFHAAVIERGGREPQRAAGKAAPIWLEVEKIAALPQRCGTTWNRRKCVFKKR